MHDGNSTCQTYCTFVKHVIECNVHIPHLIFRPHVVISCLCDNTHTRESKSKQKRAFNQIANITN